jgi:sugar lactone lactonase YvrE
MRLAGLGILMLTATLAGCAAPPDRYLSAPQQHLAWPPAPEAPRLRHLGEITNPLAAAAERGTAARLREMLYGPTPLPALVTPHAVAVNSKGDVLAVADTNAGCVHLFDLNGPRYRAIRQVPGTNEAIRCAIGVAWLGEKLVVADSMTPAVFVVDPDTGAGSVFAGEALRRPAAVACSRDGAAVYVLDAGAHCVFEFAPDGSLRRTLGERGAGEGQFNFPSHLAIGADGLWVSDSLNARVQRLDREGRATAVFGRKGDAAGDLALPKGLAVDADGNVWVVDAQFENVQAFTPEGRLLMAFGSEGQLPGEFWLPAGACIDGQNRLWIADSYNRRVQAFELLAGRGEEKP